MGVLKRVLLDDFVSQRGVSLAESKAPSSTPQFQIANRRTVKDKTATVEQDRHSRTNKHTVSFTVTTDLCYGFGEITITKKRSYFLRNDESIRTVTWDSDGTAVYPIIYLDSGTVYTPSGKKH